MSKPPASAARRRKPAAATRTHNREMPFDCPACSQAIYSAFIERYHGVLRFTPRPAEDTDEEHQRCNSMNKRKTSLAVALLMSVISAAAVELSFRAPTAQLKQKTTRHEPFIIQRLYPAARVKSDCERAMQIAAQRDEAAMDKLIEQDRITFFAVGTRVYPVKSTDMGTWWLVREKGSTEKWWISVKAFTED